jgi:hypothetical protein
MNESGGFVEGDRLGHPDRLKRGEGGGLTFGSGQAQREFRHRLVMGIDLADFVYRGPSLVEDTGVERSGRAQGTPIRPAAAHP